jgi:pSer/pThr/pTyr-binding forkhead associated (FHA) protein
MIALCAVCGYENPASAQVCQRCGVALVKSALSLDGEFEIRLLGEGRAAYRLAPPDTEGYIIGRTDEASDYLPDIDLAGHGGREQGVSRRHAALVLYRGAIHIVDLNSVNGTFLNGKRLLPETPYPLNAGDAVKLGNLNLALAPTRR